MWIQGAIRTLRGVEVCVIDERFAPDWKRERHGAVAPLCRNRLEHRRKWPWHHVEEAFTIVRNERVPIHKTADPVLKSVGDAGDDHAAIAVADENDISEIVLDQVIDD